MTEHPMTAVGSTPPAQPDRPDLVAAARLLAHLGFLAEPDLPDRPGPAYLLVAIRDEPTLAHYDPELVEYWVAIDRRGEVETLRRRTRLPIERPFSWGLIRIVDRLGVSNEYVSFGGHLSADEIDGMTVAILTSPAPMLRRGGHSQGWDVGAATVAAFYGRLLLAVDFSPGFEALAAAAAPLDLYAVFIIETDRRYRRSPTLRSRQAGLSGLIRAEAQRLERDHPAAWKAGQVLARSLPQS
jgi:hypothetical protein